MSNFKELIKKVTEFSNNSTNCWDKIKEEWELIDITKTDNYSNCLCGKEIKELCYIQNKYNKEILIVGNECIKKVCPNTELNTKTHTLFDCINKLKKDKTKAPNKLLISYCKKKDILTDWEYEFSLNTYKKRKLSEKQLYWRKEINSKILNSVNV